MPQVVFVASTEKFLNLQLCNSITLATMYPICIKILLPQSKIISAFHFALLITAGVKATAKKANKYTFYWF
jgi:hypothetical protein